MALFAGLSEGMKRIDYDQYRSTVTVLTVSKRW